MAWSGRSYSTWPGRDAVIRHGLVAMQLFDMAWSGRRYSTWPGRDAVIRHGLVGTQLFDMAWSRCSFTTYSGNRIDKKIKNGLLLFPNTTSYKRWNCQVIRPANYCISSLQTVSSTVFRARVSLQRIS